MPDATNAPDLPGIEGLELIGRGGFAVVYRGRQPAFGRDVAVKVIQHSGLDAEDRHRFDRECKAMGAISDHPGIVTLYDAAFTTDEQPYIVMPYIAGGTLHDRLAREGPMGWQEVAELGVQLAGAVETAHRAGVLHRDIKPENVLRSPYGGQLADFGIARIQGGHETRSGLVTGSLSHAAPEVLDGSAPTALGDVYSLASTLFEALTGTAPFVRRTDEALVAMMRRVMVDPPPDLRTLGIPDALAQVITTAMHKDPARRHPSAEAFGEALRHAQGALGVAPSRIAIVGAAAASVPATAVETTTPVVASPPPSSRRREPAATTVLDDLVPDDHAPEPPGDVQLSRPGGGPASAARQATLIALVLIVVLGAGVIAFLMLTDDDGTTVGSTAVPATGIGVSTSTATAPATTASPAATTVAITTTPPVDPVLAAFDQLEQFVAADSAQVDGLAEHWVPQLSAKRDGLDVDGTVFGFPEILADHQAHRDSFGAVVADGGSYNFRTGDVPLTGWYVTLVPEVFDDPAGALGWCLDHGLDRQNCFAKFLSTTVFEQTIRLNP